MSSDSSSRRRRFETAGFDAPTRSAMSPSERSNSSTSTAKARASSIGVSSSRATFSTSPSRSASRSAASRTSAGSVWQVRLARRPPAALAGDELVAAGSARAQDDRLDDPLRPDRLRERRASPRARSASAAAAGSDGSASIGHVRELGAAGAADQNLEPAARGPSARSGTVDKLHRHLPVGLRAGRARVVGDHRLAVARRLCDPDRARHARAEEQRAEVALELRGDVGGQLRPRRRPSSGSRRRAPGSGLSRVRIAPSDVTSCERPSSA